MRWAPRCMIQPIPWPWSQARASAPTRSLPPSERVGPSICPKFVEEPPDAVAISSPVLQLHPTGHGHHSRGGAPAADASACARRAACRSPRGRDAMSGAPPPSRRSTRSPHPSRAPSRCSGGDSPGASVVTNANEIDRSNHSRAVTSYGHFVLYAAEPDTGRRLAAVWVYPRGSTCDIEPVSAELARLN